MKNKSRWKGRDKDSEEQQQEKGMSEVKPPCDVGVREGGGGGSVSEKFFTSHNLGAELQGLRRALVSYILQKVSQEAKKQWLKVTKHW